VGRCSRGLATRRRAHTFSNPRSVVAQSMDDGDPIFRYLPNDQAWQTSTIARNFNNTIHFTGVAGAGLQFNFTGEALALFGTTSIEHAPFNVTIDNGTPVTISPSSPLIHSRTLTVSLPLPEAYPGDSQ
jgi:hypothetical protein